MKTFITQYDLTQSLEPIWWPEDYWQAMVLVTHKRRPLGVLRIGRYYYQEAAISKQQLEKELFGQLGFSPSIHDLTEQLDILPVSVTASKAMSVSGAASNPGISVIVCTRDRPLALQGCLKSLKQLDYPTYEVIVVDNASKDKATQQTVLKSPFRYVKESRPGLSWARNCGVAEAKYDIIAFVDDDVQVDPNWLHGLAYAFENPQVAATTGLVMPIELETDAQHLFEQYGGMGKGFQKCLFDPKHLGPQDLIAVHHVGVGANMAFRRSVLEIIGEFDTTLGVGTPSAGGEDLDIFHRVLASGLTLCYEPSALVWHQHRRDMGSLYRQIYSNGRAFGTYLIKLWFIKSVGRSKVVHFALRWFLSWLIIRLFKCLLSKYNFPLSLVWAELWGAMHAPWAYFATRRHASGRMERDRTEPFWEKLGEI